MVRLAGKMPARAQAMIYDTPNARGKLRPLPLIALGVVIALVVAIEVMIFDGYHQLRANTEEVSRSQEMIVATQEVLESILNVETGARGFLIAGDEAFLAPYYAGREKFAAAIRRAIGLAAHRTAQRERLLKVQELETRWHDGFIAPLIEKRRTLAANGRKADEAYAIVRSGVGKAFVDSMRVLLTEVERAELDRSTAARAELEDYFRKSTTRIMAGSAVVLVLVVALSAMLVRSVRVMADVNYRMELEVVERRAAEAAAQAARERLNLALEGAGLALWDYDVQSGEVFLGAHWNEMLGGARSETTTTIAALQAKMHPEDAAAVLKLVRDVVRGGRDDYRTEHRVRTIGGEWKWIESHGKVVARDGRGIALRMTGTNADISERKQVERMKNEFVATVSHELRTPLTAMIGGLGMVKDNVFGDIPEGAKPLLEMAYQNGERLRDLISNILDMEKMASGAMSNSPAPVDVADILRRAVALNQAYAETLSVRFRLDLGTEGAKVHADPDRLMQVLTNLLSNAAKFSPRGETVTLSCKAAAGVVTIAVHDSGPGIPAAFRSRIFGKFAQADSSDTRRKGGTGLGLSIAKALVEKMQGRIYFESEAGRGTTFFVELPQLACASAAARDDSMRTS